MTELNNGILKVAVDTHAALNSLVDVAAGEELLWQGDEKSWTGSDIIIFPLVGRLQDGFYTVNGKKFSSLIHGLACYENFRVTEKEPHRAVLTLTSSERTMDIYPFPFELSVAYSLNDRTLDVTLTVSNLGTEEMPYYLGAHPGIRLDATETDDGTDTSGNYIVLDEEPLTQYALDDSNRFVAGSKPCTLGKVIELSKQLFARDAVMLKELGGGVTVVRKNGRKIRFDIEERQVTAFWSHAKYGAYVCVEPWLGLPDCEPPVRELSQKPQINRLAAGGKRTFGYSITI